LEIITLNATLEVLAVVLLKIQAFWDEALYQWASGSCCFLVMSYSGLIIPRKMECMTLVIMALISLKTSRTAEPVTQCNIPEELNT
jgi:hypothetical protein